MSTHETYNVNIMKKILVAFFFFPFFVFAQDAQLEKYIDSLMAPVNRADMPGTLLLVARDGKPLIRKAYGMASLELQVAARPDHLFGIGSVGKQFTAVAMLQLAWKNKISLSDDIRKYIPEFNTRGKLITIKHLLTHTSGISSSEQAAAPDFIYNTGIFSEKEFLDFAMKQDLLFAPGSDWSYNNFGFVIASFIIERVSGQTYSEYMTKNIFQPAGMVNSFVPDETKPLKNVVSSYYKESGGSWMTYFPRKWLTAQGSGNIVSCMDDMLKWDIALREEKLLPAAWLQKAWTSDTLTDGRTTDYGFGWAVSKNNGLAFVSHGGDFYGYHTYSVHVPGEKLYFLCANFYATSGEAGSTVRKIVVKMLPIAYPSPKKTAINIDDYTGVYAVHRVSTRIAKQTTEKPFYVKIAASGDTLTIQPTAGEKNYLRPAGKDSFLLGNSEGNWFLFNRDENNKVNAISVKGSFWNFGPEVFNKRLNISLPAPLISKTINSELLKKYAGVYHRVQMEFFFPTSIYFIETDGVKLYNKTEGKRQELIPISDNKFVRKGVEDISFEFKTAANGSMILTVSGLRDYDFRKIK